jgi:trigger factor
MNKEKKENKFIKIISSQKEKGSRVIITVGIKKELVVNSINDILSKISETKEIKGFRKGKAPKELIFAQYKKDIIEESYSHIQNIIINFIYENDVNPLRIYFEKDFLENIKLEAEDFEIKIICYKKPEIKKVNLEKIKVKKETAEKKFNEEKEKYQKENNKEVLQDLKDNEEKYLNNIYESLIIETLLEEIVIEKEDIPEYIIREHTDRSLENLENFSKNLNMSLDEYLSQSKTNKDKIIKDLEKEVIDQLKLDIFTEEYAKENKLEVTKEDIESQLTTIPEEELKNINAEEMVYNIRYYKSLKEIVNLVKKQS